MKEYFDTQIKPLNDKLGRDLGLHGKKIEVKKIEHDQDVPVWITFRSQQGNMVTFSNRQIRSYRALGLNI